MNHQESAACNEQTGKYEKLECCLEYGNHGKLRLVDGYSWRTGGITYMTRFIFYPKLKYSSFNGIYSVAWERLQVRIFEIYLDRALCIRIFRKRGNNKGQAVNKICTCTGRRCFLNSDCSSQVSFRVHKFQCKS